jgi:hypothetical protein
MRALKILGVVFVALAVSAAGAWLWIRHAADRKWAAAQERIRAIAAAHPPVVPPLPSTAASKNLQIQFVAAIRAIVRRIGPVATDPYKREQEAWKFVKSRQGGEAVEVLLEDALESLDLLHAGGRKCAATPSEFPPGWRGEWDAPTLQFLLHCGVLRSRQARGAMKPFEAAETLLDSLQLVRFWAASGRGESRIDALYSLDGTLEELREILSRESLSAAQLQALERELEPLDQAILSPVRYLEPGLARWAETLNEWDERVLNNEAYRWRILPRPLMKAQAFEAAEGYVRQLTSAPTFLDLARHAQQMGKFLQDTKNPILASGLPFIGSLHWIPLERMAEIRLLRMAARYRATGEILKLADPYGGDLLHRRTEHRMRFWSVDGNGRDDGGDAGSSGRWDWRLWAASQGQPVPAQDIVLEVDHPKPE